MLLVYARANGKGQLPSPDLVPLANGTSQDVALRAVIPAGGESRVIDLVGDERLLRRVDFTYEAESIGRGRKALIRLCGRR